MIVQTIKVNDCTPQTIVIGRRGTYDTLQIAFDLSYLVESYGNGVAVLAVKRSQDESAYPAVTAQEDDLLLWTVSETDTYYVGAGEAQLMWYVDGGLAKTIIYPMVVMKDILMTSEEAPDAYQEWVDSLIAEGAETLQNAQDAAQSASDAETAKGDAVTAKEAAESAATRSETAASNAETYASSAANSAGVASQKAIDAALSADSASSSASSASSSAGSASASASSASESATAASNSASSASTSAQTATTKANEASSSASSAAGSAQTATTKASEAATSATNAQTSAGQAANSATAAGQSATNAAGSATTATNQAGIATTKAGEAAQSATAASEAQTAAETAQGKAEDAQEAAEAAQQAAEQAAQDVIDKAPVIINTASGDIASFPDGADGMPIKHLVANIEAVQDLHGQSSPYPAGGGKQLIPYPYVDTSKTEQGVTGTANNDGSVNIVSTGTGTSTFFFNLQTANSGAFVLKAGTYTLSGGTSYVFVAIKTIDSVLLASVGTTPQSFTLTEDTICYVYLSCISSSTYNATIKPMLNVGSSAESFASYSNICSISGWTGAEIERTGKNLLDIDTAYADTSKFTIAGNKVTAKVNDFASNIINIPSELVGVQLTFSAKLNNVPESTSSVLARAVVNGSNINGNRVNTGNTDFSFVTFTPTSTNDGVKFAYASGGTNNITIEDIQLEVGSSRTAYAPYTGNQISVNWEDEAGTVYGGTLDVVTGELTVTKAYALLNNPDLWAELPSASTTPFQYQYNFNDRKLYNDSYTGLICSYHKVDSSDPTNTARWSGVSNIKFGIKSPTLTLDQIKADASAGKIAICYDLATPQIYQLDPVTVNTLLGNNTVYVDCGSVTVDYPADTGIVVTEQSNAINQKQDATSYVTLSGTIVTQTGADNTMYLCGELAELTFTAPATGQTAIRFTSGTTPTVATFTGVTWLNGFDPTAIEASKTYEVNILNGLGVVAWT